MTVFEAALEYVELGMSVIPTLPRSKKPYFSLLRAIGWGKAWEPAMKAIVDKTILSRWFGNGTDSGVALIGGQVSGNLLYVDFDDPTAYKRWAKKHVQEVNSTAVQRTPNGYHVFFRVTVETPASGVLKFDGRRVGEIRGNGQYVVAAPSLHPSNVPYVWLRHPRDGIYVVDSLADVDLRELDDPHGEVQDHGQIGNPMAVAWARDMLAHLSPERCEDYTGWLEVGMALRCLDAEGLELWHYWSATSAKYEPPILDAKWKSFGTRGRGLASLAYWAKMDTGYTGQYLIDRRVKYAQNWETI